MRSLTRLCRACQRWLVPLAAFLVLVMMREPIGAADRPDNVAPTTECLPVPLDLETARRIALERQPGLAAYRASLAAAQTKVHALESLHVPTFLRPDLPVRRCQARIGLSIAQAQLIQQEWETTYAATRTYLTVLYAREQARVAQDLLQILQTLRDTTEGFVGKKESSVTRPQYDRVRALLEVTAGRQQEAQGGVERALAALREALGVGPDCALEVPNGQLRANPSPITREQVIALALERRGELGQAGGAAQVAALEVKAQAAARGRTAQTFAAGADIHAQPVPQGLRDGDYRPGGVGLEMPVQLVGARCDRVNQAQALSGRADAVFEKTRGLVALEAQDVYYRYLDWSSRAPRIREAARIAEKRREDVRGNFNPAVEKPRANLDEVLDASLLATQLLLQANEAEFRYLLILADLERVTAGGFCPNYLPPGPPPNGPNTPAHGGSALAPR